MTEHEGVVTAEGGVNGLNQCVHFISPSLATVNHWIGLVVARFPIVAQSGFDMLLHRPSRERLCAAFSC